MHPRSLHGLVALALAVAICTQCLSAAPASASSARPVRVVGRVSPAAATGTIAGSITSTMTGVSGVPLEIRIDRPIPNLPADTWPPPVLDRSIHVGDSYSVDVAPGTYRIFVWEPGGDNVFDSSTWLDVRVKAGQTADGNVQLRHSQIVRIQGKVAFAGSHPATSAVLAQLWTFDPQDYDTGGWGAALGLSSALSADGSYEIRLDKNWMPHAFWVVFSDASGMYRTSVYGSADGTRAADGTKLLVPDQPTTFAGIDATMPALPNVERVFGIDRFQTAEAVWAHAFKVPYFDPKSVGLRPHVGYRGTTVVIASGQSYADALVAGPLAATLGAPVLLVGRSGLTQSVVDDMWWGLDSLGPIDDVVIVGGPKVVSTRVEYQLTHQPSGFGTPKIKRIYGRDRYETSALVAREILDRRRAAHKASSPSRAFVAYGGDFPDALAAAPVAGYLGAPILLTRTNRGDAAVKGYLRYARALQSHTDVTVVGDSSVVGTAIAGYYDADRRLAGATRYGTAAAIARYGLSQGMTPSAVGVATGKSFPDGLAASAALARFDRTLVLTRPGDVPPETQEFFATTPGIRKAFVYGGPGVVSDAVTGWLTAHIP